MKTVLKGNFIALNVYINNLEKKSHTSKLTEHLKVLEQKQQTHPGGLYGNK